jgi:hypothetical protein
VRLRTAFAEQYDEIAAKLLTEVCGFLVGAGDLDADFRAQAKHILLDAPDTASDKADGPEAPAQLALDGKDGA